MYRLRFLLVALSIATVVAGLRCGEDGTGPERMKLTITPDSAVVETSASQLFEAGVDGQTPEVMWFVGAERGGTAATGIIDTSGLYIAPHYVPDDSVLTLTAVAADDPGLSATAKVLVRSGQGVPWIMMAPSDTTLSPGESVVFVEQVSGCPNGEVTWSVEALWGGTGDVGSIGPDGSYTVPLTMTESVPLLVRATSQSCSDLTGIAIVNVAAPVEFIVELENFTDFGDDGLGVSILGKVSCSQASGNFMVKYMDYPGEWIEVPLTVPGSGTYELTLHYAAEWGDTLRGTVSFEGCGATAMQAEVDFVMDEGTGLG
jgi:hypothetical protein